MGSVIDDHDQEGMEVTKALAADTIASQSLSVMGVIGVGEGKTEQGEVDMSPGSREGAFGEGSQMPALFELAEGGILDEGAQVVEVENAQRLRDIQAGDEGGLIGQGIGFVAPASDDQGIDRVRFEVVAIDGQLVVSVAIG